MCLVQCSDWLYFQTRMPVYVSHTPAGTSVQNMVHFSQVCFVWETTICAPPHCVDAVIVFCRFWHVSISVVSDGEIREVPDVRLWLQRRQHGALWSGKTTRTFLVSFSLAACEIAQMKPQEHVQWNFFLCSCGISCQSERRLWLRHDVRFSFSFQQNTPPLYDATEVKTPVALFSGGKDWLADPQVRTGTR